MIFSNRIKQKQSKIFAHNPENERVVLTFAIQNQL
jgi:hypothetical protein